MKQAACLLVTFCLVLGILLIAVADVNHGHGPGYVVEDSHGDGHGEDESHADIHEDGHTEDQHGVDHEEEHADVQTPEASGH